MRNVSIEGNDDDSSIPEDEEGSLKMAVGATNTRKKMMYSRKVFAVISTVFLVYAIGNMTLFITPGVREFVQQYRLVYLCAPLPLLSKILLSAVDRMTHPPKLILLLHPDQSQRTKTDSRVGWATGASDTEQFMLVKEAYDVLRNEEKRKEYDLANSREGGFLMEATLKTQQMSTQRRNIQRAEWSADVIPDAKKKSKSTVYSHFRSPEDEYIREKQKNRMLAVLGATVMVLIAANILYIRQESTSETTTRGFSSG